MVNYAVISDHSVNPEMRVKEPTLISLFLRNANPGWVSPTHEIDVMGFTDSFHNGAADGDALDTGFTRLFSTAIIELEYVFATMADATT